MNTTAKKCAQWAVFLALCFIGCIAFMVLAGDDNPANPLPFSRWLLMKVVAGVVLYACYLCGRTLHRFGFLPEYLDKTLSEED